MIQNAYDQSNCRTPDQQHFKKKLIDKLGVTLHSVTLHYVHVTFSFGRFSFRILPMCVGLWDLNLIRRRPLTFAINIWCVRLPPQR